MPDRVLERNTIEPLPFSCARSEPYQAGQRKPRIFPNRPGLHFVSADSFSFCCNAASIFASKNLKVDTLFALFVLRPVGRISREPCSGEGVVVHFHKNCMSDIPGHDERTLMSNTERHDIAEGLFAPKQSHEEIRDAIKLEEARRAAMVKNLYRLRNLRLSKNNSSSE